MMIEAIVIAYLNDALDVPAYMEMPESKGKSFVVVEKTAGGETDHISSATLALQSYGPSLEAAALLNNRVKTAMKEIISLDMVTSCRLNSDYNFTDTESKRYRYQAVFNLTYYEEE